MKVIGANFAAPASLEVLRRDWVGAHMLGPERWWTMPEQDEARGNSGGSPKWF